MNQNFVLSACALAACAALGSAHAQETTASAVDKVEVVAKRETRVSKGATGLPLTIVNAGQDPTLFAGEVAVLPGGRCCRNAAVGRSRL